MLFSKLNVRQNNYRMQGHLQPLTKRAGSFGSAVDERTRTKLYDVKVIYSCFEKGSLTNGEKLARQSRKLLWVMAVFTVA